MSNFFALDSYLARFLLHLDLSITSHRNAWHMVAEIFWAAFYNATAFFNTAYALRLGADNYQAGLLTSLPALVAVVVSIPFGRFLQTRTRRKAWVFGSLSIFRSAYLLIALIPWFPNLGGWSYGSLVIATLVLFSIPLHFFNVGIIPIQAEVLTEDLRLSVISARSMVYNGVISISLFAFGLWLNVLPLPLNYQTMYLMGYLVNFFSLNHLFRLEMAPSNRLIENRRPGKSVLTSLFEFRKELIRNSEFERLTRNTLFLNLGIWAAAPIYILYFVREIHVTDGWLGFYNAVSALGLIGGNLIFRKIMSHWSKYDTLKRVSIVLGVFPILVGLTTNSNPILFIAGVGNLFMAGFNLSHYNSLLEVMPVDSRPTYSAVYNTVTNLGIFVSPLLGVGLAEMMGFRSTLVICGLATLLGSSLFWFSPVKPKAMINPAA